MEATTELCDPCRAVLWCSPLWGMVMANGSSPVALAGPLAFFFHLWLGGYLLEGSAAPVPLQRSPLFPAPLLLVVLLLPACRPAPAARRGVVSHALRPAGRRPAPARAGAPGFFFLSCQTVAVPDAAGGMWSTARAGRPGYHRRDDGGGVDRGGGREQQ